MPTRLACTQVKNDVACAVNNDDATFDVNNTVDNVDNEDGVSEDGVSEDGVSEDDVSEDGVTEDDVDDEDDGTVDDDTDDENYGRKGRLEDDLIKEMNALALVGDETSWCLSKTQRCNTLFCTSLYSYV